MTNEEQPPSTKRKRATVTPLERKVQRTAKVLAKHEKVLGPTGMSALYVATLQVVSNQLADIQALLRATGVPTSGPTAQWGPMAQSPTAIGPTCVLCGRPGVYQSRTAKVERGQQRPWYCAGEHAQWAQGEDGEAARASRVMPSAGAPNIGAALAALEGESA